MTRYALRRIDDGWLLVGMTPVAVFGTVAAARLWAAKNGITLVIEAETEQQLTMDLAA